MPNLGGAPTRLPIEDSYLELLAETLDGLDTSHGDNFSSGTFARSPIWIFARLSAFSSGTRRSRGGAS